MRKSTPYSTLIIVLGVIALTSIVLCFIIICYCNNSDCKDIPSGIIAIGSAAVGGLTGLLIRNNPPYIPEIPIDLKVSVDPNKTNDKEISVKLKTQDELFEELLNEFETAIERNIQNFKKITNEENKKNRRMKLDDVIKKMQELKDELKNNFNNDL